MGLPPANREKIGLRVDLFRYGRTRTVIDRQLPRPSWFRQPAADAITAQVRSGTAPGGNWRDAKDQ